MIGTRVRQRSGIRELPECDVAAMERLELLVGLLAEENSSKIWFRRPALAEVWRRHIVDSAQILAHVPRGTCCRGWILAAERASLGWSSRPCGLNARIVLVESRTRRADWLSRACEQLELAAVDVAATRLERMESRPVSVISARAFAPLEKLLELSARFSTESTRWLLPKGRSAREELSRLRGWNHLFHVEQSLTDSRIRCYRRNTHWAGRVVNS